MRISDWSSDVCSSDLGRPAGDRWRTGSSCGSYRLSLGVVGIGLRRLGGGLLGAATEGCGEQAPVLAAGTVAQIGRASCRERVCPYVYISVFAVYLKKKTHPRT